MPQTFTPRQREARALELDRLYRSDSNPVAFVDETFRVDGTGQRFYAMAASVVARDVCADVRSALLDAYDDEPLHASQMWKEAKKVSLRAAIDVVSQQPAISCIVVQTHVAEDDTSGNDARSSCLANLVRAVTRAHDVSLYVADSRGRLDADRVDTELIHQLRSEQHIDRDVNLVHRQPSEEALIGLADVASWTFRQDFLGTSNRNMFDPLRDKVRVHALKSGPRAAAKSAVSLGRLPAGDEEPASSLIATQLISSS